MDVNEISFTLSMVFLIGAIPGIVLFIIFYSRKSPWKKHFVGRSIMYLACALAFLMVFNITALSLGEYPGRWLVRLVGYFGLFASVWRLFFTLRSLQKNPPEDDGPDVVALPIPESEPLDDRL